MFAAIDSNELMPPMKDEIKDNQWLGVTVRSQKPGGKVIVSKVVRELPYYIRLSFNRH